MPFNVCFKEASCLFDLNFCENNNSVDLNFGEIWKVPEGGAASWDELTNKPFETIGNNLEVVNNVLQVKVAEEVQEDNTLPITSAAVYMEIGNIETLLSFI